MHQRRAGVAAMIALLALSCSTASPNPSDLAGVADSARAVAQRVIENSNKLDFAAAFADYSTDPDARYVEGGVLFPSLDSLKQSYAALAPGLELVANAVDAWDVVVLGPEAASVTLPIHLRIKAKGRPEYAGQYVWSAIVQRRGGRWQLVQTHESWQNAEQLIAAITPAPAKPPQ